jgi:phenylalanyl-tRNA synthetase beta chain
MNFFSKLFHRKNKTSANFDGIVAAKVLDVQKHPNADRLRVVKLDVGDNIIEPIVCGAFNFAVGDIVALALPGAKIAQDIHSPEHKSFVLEKAKIRGIESQGMICAAFELGLATKPGEGIMLLKNAIKPGSKFESKMIK